MGKEVRTTAEIERLAANQLWIAASSDNIRNRASGFRHAFHRLLDDAPKPIMEGEISASVMEPGDVRLQRTSRAAPTRTLTAVESVFSDAKLREELEKQTGFSLSYASTFALEGLRRTLHTIDPKMLPLIAEALDEMEDSKNGLLLAITQYAHNDRERAEILAFARHPQARSILQLYEDISEHALGHALRTSETQRALGLREGAFARVYLTERRADLLLRLASRLVRDHGEEADADTLRKALALLRDALWHENEQVQVMDEIVQKIPAERVSALPIERLDEVEILAPRKAADFSDNKQLKVIRAHVKAAFEGFDAFLAQDNAYVSAAFFEGELITAFGVSVQPDNILHFDWMVMNQRSELKLLTQAAVKACVQKAKETLKAEGSTCLAKPHTRPFSNNIEDSGFVGYGLVQEEGHTYVACRETRSESGAYATKSLSSDTIREMVRGLPANELQDIVVEGRACKIARVMFIAPLAEDYDSGKSSADIANNFAAKDRGALDGKEANIYRWIEEMEGTHVLTRCVPLYGSPDTYAGVLQIYGVLFESSVVDPDDQKKIEASVRTSS